MDWARDQLGNDVPAWRGGISGYGLVCPSCGEPVRRRAGLERRPHFAHYSNRARPECENYFPSQAIVALAGSPFGVRSAPPQPRRGSLSCGLFLVQDPLRGSLALWLRIPPMDLGRVANGRLEVQTGLGLRTYDVADLRVARLVPLVPQAPLAEISGFGALLPLAAHAAGQVAAFGAGRNLFYVGERGGRLVFVDEPLEWGSRYRLLSAVEITPPLDLGVVLNWRPEGKFGDWYSYEVALPALFPGSRPQLPAQIAAFIGRRIRSGQPRLYVVNPLPHHIDIDGTYVYPEPPDAVLLRKSGFGAITVTTPSGLASVSVTELDDQWAQLDGLTNDEHEYMLAIGGSEQRILRIEDCELFRPSGVVARADGHAWNLCSDAPVPASELAQCTVIIDCGSARIAAHVARMNRDWIQDGSTLVLSNDKPINLYAGSFGELRGVLLEPSQTVEPMVFGGVATVAATSVGAHRWLEDLVAKSFGQDGVARVRRYFSNPSLTNLYLLGPVLTSPLLPYIRAVQARQQPLRES